MSRKRVQQILPQLKSLSDMKNRDRKKFIASCNKNFILCICECVKNALKGYLPLKKCQLKSLSRHKQSLRQLALKKTSLSRRKKILQRGGLLGLLIGPLVSSLSSLLGNLIRNGSN